MAKFVTKNFPKSPNLVVTLITSSDQHHFYRFKTERVGEGDAKARQNARRTGRERGEFSFRGVDPRTGGEKGQAGLRRGKSGERSQSGARQIDIDSLNAGKILIINFSDI